MHTAICDELNIEFPIFSIAERLLDASVQSGIALGLSFDLDERPLAVIPFVGCFTLVRRPVGHR
jgi:hypothetical protein